MSKMSNQQTAAFGDPCSSRGLQEAEEINQPIEPTGAAEEGGSSGEMQEVEHERGAKKRPLETGSDGAQSLAAAPLPRRRRVAVGPRRRFGPRRRSGPRRRLQTGRVAAPPQPPLECGGVAAPPQPPLGCGDADADATDRAAQSDAQVERGAHAASDDGASDRPRRLWNCIAMLISEQFVAALDVGTTKIKCHLVDYSGSIAHSAETAVELLYSEPGCVEINPYSIWDGACNVIRSVIEDSGLSFKHINCLGLSCQRCTFITWNRSTGIPYHRLITWKDRRASSMIHSMNNSYTLKALKMIAKALYYLTRYRKFLTASGFKFENVHVIVKLMWVLRENPQIIADAEKGDVAFGTLDSWLLYKFQNSLHVTDYSNASATAMFDPFEMTWMHPLLRILGIPFSILPEICDSSGSHFKEVSPSTFGTPIPIRASIADQSASLFGSYCLKEGSLKLTLGTGAFLDLNSGKSLPSFVQGFSPIVAWKIGSSVTYAGECSASDFGTVIEWAVNAGLCKDVDDCTEKATLVNDCDGVFFIPAFSGLRTPIDCASALTGFIGIKSTTRVPHMMRAILESLSFIAASLYEAYAQISDQPSKEIRVDGGVSNNDFILQKLSNITGTRVVRYKNVERTALGAAYLAGIANGFWSDVEQIVELGGAETAFTPNIDEVQTDRTIFGQWKEVVPSFCRW